MKRLIALFLMLTIVLGLCACGESGSTEKEPAGLQVGFARADMPSADHVWGAYLRKNGFRRYLVDDHGWDVYTVRDFCGDHPRGTFVLSIDSHVVCVDDGDYYDSWDSGNEIPIYFWTKE